MKMTATARRWSVLFVASLVMMMGYVFWDILSPVSTLLKAPVSEGGMGWSAAEYGFYAGSYSIFNIFLLMLFFGGIILDKCGIRLTGLLATGSMLLGAVINYHALTAIAPTSVTTPWLTLFGLIPSPIKTQVLVAAMGFALFGMGCDITGITVSKIITKWFTGHELASAMGVQVAMARLGTASALSFSPLIAQSMGLSASVLAGVAVLLFAFILFIGYCPADRRFDRQAKAQAPKSSDDTFHFRDFTAVLGNAGFWGIALLCVAYYSSIRPFMKFASDLMVNNFGVAQGTAGWLVAAIPYGAIVLSPLFGTLFDRVGHGPQLMLTGCVTLTLSLTLLAFPLTHSAWYALAVMIFVGIAFSLVPAVLWPSIPKLVPLKRLGTAYSITYFLQNIGLMSVPVWAGHIIDAHTAANGHVDYTVPMLLFIGFSLIAVLIAATLTQMSRRDQEAGRAKE